MYRLRVLRSVCRASFVKPSPFRGNRVLRARTKGELFEGPGAAVNDGSTSRSFRIPRYLSKAQRGGGGDATEPV